MESPVQNAVYALHGLAGNDVWGVTTDGEVLHYDGAAWSLIADLETRWCYALWEAAPDRVFVGGDARIEQWDGSAWSVGYVSPDSALITDFWGRSPTEVFAVGQQGTLARFDGSSWEALPVDPDLDFIEIDGSGSEVWATLIDRGRIAKIDGSAVAVLDLPWNDWFLGVAVRGPEDAIAVGSLGSIATLRAGEWRLDSSRYSFPLVKITGYEGAPCAFGDRVSYLRVEEDGVKRVSIDAASVSDAWSPDGEEIVLVGTSGRIRRGRDDRWTRDSSGTDEDLLAVHGTSASDVWAVGPSKTVLHYDGARWTRQPLPADWYDYWLFDVWAAAPNDVYVVSNDLLRFDGVAWSRIEIAESGPLYSLWGRASDEIFAVGEGGTIVRFDGKTASAMASGTRESLVDVHGNSRGDVCAVGGQTILWLIDDVWVKAVNPADEDLGSVWVDDDGFAYVVGEYGAVLRISRPTRP
jgi:hypothetical protein